MGNTLNLILSVVLPVLVAGLTTLIAGLLFKLNTALETMPDLLKRVIVPIIASLLTLLSTKLNVVLQGHDLATLMPADVQALLSAAIAYLFHSQDKQKAIAVKVGASSPK